MDKAEDIDQQFMKIALKEAKKAYDEGEVPVGACIVFEGEIIAKAHNQVELLQDATAHAELLAITQAESTLGNWRLLNCTLYSTLEPCPMCAGAAILSRIQRIVWGARDLRHGADGTLFSLFDTRHPIHNIERRQLFLEPECASLMRAFFRERRVL